MPCAVTRCSSWRWGGLEEVVQRRNQAAEGRERRGRTEQQDGREPWAGDGLMTGDLAAAYGGELADGGLGHGGGSRLGYPAGVGSSRKLWRMESSGLEVDAFATARSPIILDTPLPPDGRSTPDPFDVIRTLIDAVYGASLPEVMRQATMRRSQPVRV